MKVLYNATSVRVGGGLSYSRSQIDALAAVLDIELTVLTSRWNHELVAAAVPGSVTLISAPIPNVPVRFGWEQTVLPVLARRYDLLISPANFATLLCPIPQVLILQNPNYVGGGPRLESNAVRNERAKIALSHLSMRRADLVVAISDALAAEIRSEARLSSINLVTVKSGAPKTDDADGGPTQEVAEAVDRLVGAEPYLLSVANDCPHKRLDDLAQLPSRIVARNARVPARVVFAGTVSPERRRRLRALAGADHGSLVFLGLVSDRSIVLELYRRAAVSVSTSELEAFPLTLHEALSQGSPLVVADIPPHRELGGDQAHFFPVGDLQALETAIEAALTGPRPAPTFQRRSWSDHADELASHLRTVAAQ